MNMQVNPFAGNSQVFAPSKPMLPDLSSLPNLKAPLTPPANSLNSNGQNGTPGGSEKIGISAPAVTQGAPNPGATGGGNIANQGSLGTGTNVIADPVTRTDAANNAMKQGLPFAPAPFNGDANYANQAGNVANQSLYSQTSDKDGRLGNRTDYNELGLGKEFDALKQKKDGLTAQLKDATPEERKVLQQEINKIEGQQDNLQETSGITQAAKQMIGGIVNRAMDGIKKASKPITSEVDQIAAKRKRDALEQEEEDNQLDNANGDQGDDEDGVVNSKSTAMAQAESEVSRLSGGMA
jgi:hypothetical protein